MRGAARGVNVWVETLIQYLLLDRTDAEQPEFRRREVCHVAAVARKKNQDVLWNGLRQGLIERSRPITRRSIS